MSMQLSACTVFLFVCRLTVVVLMRILGFARCAVLRLTLPLMPYVQSTDALAEHIHGLANEAITDRAWEDDAQSDGISVGFKKIPLMRPPSYR